MQTVLLYIYTESSLHAGTGSGVSAIDLPIQRERITGYPNIQGSGVKGALRNQCLSNDENAVNAVFGPDENASEYAGALSVGEARIVLFPVRSLLGVFAYVTCHHVLARLFREVSHAQLNLPTLDLSQLKAKTGQCFINSPSNLIDNRQIVLEEFAFEAQTSEAVNNLGEWLKKNALPQNQPAYSYWRDKLMTSLVVLSDDDFVDFVTHSTEVVTRIKLKRETKTVDDTIGGLWTQEALPSDTLLVSAVTARRLRKNSNWGGLQNNEAVSVVNWITNPANISTRIQIGGDETTGLGCVALNWQTK